MRHLHEGGVAGRRITWITSVRFDVLPDKSTWLETAKELCGRGFRVEIVTGWKRERYYPDSNPARMVYLRALDLPLIYRVTILLNAYFWIMRHGDREDIVIMNQDEMWLAPLLWLSGRTNLHLDIRTLPVRGTSPKDRLDRWLFWSAAVGRLKGFFKGFSFITRRLKRAVEEEFGVEYSNYTIWSSGVATSMFAPSPRGLGAERGKRQGFRLFYHGSLSRSRGLEEVIKACAALEEKQRDGFEFVIVGGGAELERLRDVVAQYRCDDLVKLAGFLPYEQIPARIAEADCCICPLPDLLQWRVSSPLKLFEYLACAKPLILTPIAAHRDVAGDLEFVIWTDGFAAADFGKAIRQARDDLDRLTRAAGKGPELVARNHDWSVQAGHLADYLERTFPQA